MSANEEVVEKTGFMQSKAGRMLMALVVIVVGATIPLVAANLATFQTIADNRLAVLQNGLVSVLDLDPGDLEVAVLFDEETPTTNRVITKTFPQDTGKDFSVWIAHDGNNNITGYAIRLTGGGFQGIIDIVVGLTPDTNQTTGMEVLESGETPGLGDEMKTDEFRDQFYGPDKIGGEGGFLTDPNVDFVKYRDPTADEANKFRAITGATYTSNAIRLFFNAALTQLRNLRDAGDLDL